LLISLQLIETHLFSFSRPVAFGYEAQKELQSESQAVINHLNIRFFNHFIINIKPPMSIFYCRVGSCRKCY